MLILTEKPSVAKSFAEALNVPRKGFVYENNNYCITNALGHLLENYAPEDYHPNLKKWTLESLPIIPEKVRFKPIEKTKEQLKIIKTCFDKHKNKPLLLATDAEREGELIGAEILDYVGFKKYDTAKRFWVSEALTPEVIKSGIDKAKYLTEYAEYKKQGYARQQADWLVGMNLTRLITLKTNKILHFGRVQTAILAAIYKREQSINHFIPEKYFEVIATLQSTNSFSVKLINLENKEFPTRFSNESKVLQETISIKNNMKSGRITELKKEQKSMQPPKLYNLTALQKIAHKKYSYSPEQTLDIAQSLYENHKCMSYPRTPSRVMGDDNVNLFKSIYEKLVNSYTGSPLETVISGVDTKLILESNKNIFNTKELQDHHALIPLAPLPTGCSKEEENIYYLVFTSFFTVIKPNYIYNSISIDVDISGRLFKGNGIEVLQQGWKTKISNTEDEDDEKESDNYSGLEKNKEYAVNSINLEEKQTEPQKHYTFSSLLQLMENPRNDEGKRLIGLGTPATRGSILQKLVDRKYIALKGKSIFISDEGIFLIENILKNKLLAEFISLPETTKWEEQLHENTDKFLENIKDFVTRAVNSTEMTQYKNEKIILGKCPLCNSNIYEGKNNYYCSNYKTQTPCSFSIGKEICGSKITDTDIITLLSGKKTKIKKLKSPRTGKDFQAALSLKEDKIEFLFSDKK